MSQLDIINFPCNGRPVTHPYRNWKGETALRTFVPVTIYWGSNEWHPEPQWLLAGWDIDKDAERTFALSGFLEARP